MRVIATDKSSIKWPKLVADMTAAFFNELEEITASDPDFDEFEVQPKAIKALARGSSEVFEDSDPDLLDLLRTHLNTILALKLDREILVGNDAKGFPGLLTMAGITQIDAAGAMTNYDALLRAVGILSGKSVPGPYAAIAHPFTETYLSLLKRETGSNEPLSRPPGVPELRTTTQIGRTGTTSPILVFSPANVVYVRRRDITVEVDRSQEFSSDAVLVRGKLRGTLFVPYEGAPVVKIVNAPSPDPATGGAMLMGAEAEEAKPTTRKR
jgi:HK97 family phage major capsid protein